MHFAATVKSRPSGRVRRVDEKPTNKSEGRVKPLNCCLAAKGAVVPVISLTWRTLALEVLADTATLRSGLIPACRVHLQRIEAAYRKCSLRPYDSALRSCRGRARLHETPCACRGDKSTARRERAATETETTA